MGGWTRGTLSWGSEGSPGKKVPPGPTCQARNLQPREALLDTVATYPFPPCPLSSRPRPQQGRQRQLGEEEPEEKSRLWNRKTQLHHLGAMTLAKSLLFEPQFHHL